MNVISSSKCEEGPIDHLVPQSTTSLCTGKNAVVEMPLEKIRLPIEKIRTRYQTETGGMH